MFFHQLHKLTEEVIAVVRTGGRFRMVLHTENGQFTVAKAFIRSIVEIDVGDFNLRLVEGIRVDRKPVILRRNLDFVCQQILHGMVCPPVTELQLERLPSQG